MVRELAQALADDFGAGNEDVQAFRGQEISSTSGSLIWLTRRSPPGDAAMSPARSTVAASA
jgi:hypothetical protein